MSIGPISNYDSWKLASPYDGEPEPEPEEDSDGDDETGNDEHRADDD